MIRGQDVGIDVNYIMVGDNLWAPRPHRKGTAPGWSGSTEQDVVTKTVGQPTADKARAPELDECFAAFVSTYPELFKNAEAVRLYNQAVATVALDRASRTDRRRPRGRSRGHQQGSPGSSWTRGAVLEGARGGVGGDESD